MRFGWVLAGTLLLAACGQKDGATPSAATDGVVPASATTVAETAVRPELDYAALSGYDTDAWFLSPGWPGEYPPGFAVLDPDVKVPARARPNPTDPQDVSCLLPQYANYQLWNNARTEEDDLEYFVATKKALVTVLEDAVIEFISKEGTTVPLALTKGQQMTYLRYVGEGFTVVSFEGQEYDINEGELSSVTDISSARLDEDLWVRVSCMGGKQGWLMFDEVIEEPGIYPSPIIGYGDGSDIDPADVERVREAVPTDAYGVAPQDQEIIPPSEE